MRSHATKTQPKRATMLKTSFKGKVSTKQVKKKQLPTKNVKNVVKKTNLKAIKKNISKSDNNDNEGESKTKSDKLEETKEGEPSTSCDSLKKNKNEKIEKKLEQKKTLGSASKKKIVKQTTKELSTQSESEDSQSESGDEIKYKINLDHIKFQKNKTLKKSSPGTGNIKRTILSTEKSQKESENKDNPKSESSLSESVPQVLTSDSQIIQIMTENPQPSSANTANTNNTSKGLLLTSPLKSKQENERPPKFFTSTRSPRVVDIDLKSCKTTKTNLSLTEKISIIKSSDEKNQTVASNDESTSSITKEPEIDVYTFTDYKVDSPKSVLPDFRSPIGKTDGRVRPIARVKGTIIDKSKGDVEKKKYSPHRPIEDVVKQLKAGKKAEETRILGLINSNNTTDSANDSNTSELITNVPVQATNDKPRIVSKSYKMVARKSVIPGSTLSTDIAVNKASTSSKIESAPDKANQNEKKILEKKKPSKTSNIKKLKEKIKKNSGKNKITDDDIDRSTFSLNTSSTTSHAYSSSDESDDAKESSDSEYIKNIQKKLQNSPKKGKNLRDSDRKNKSKDLDNLSPDSLVDLKETSSLMKDDIPNTRRLKLLSMWTGPKKHRMASLNALAKVHCLYENESRSHSELGLMKTIEKSIPTPAKPQSPKKKITKQDKRESTSESEYEKKEKMVLESSEEDTPIPVTRNLRVVPGARGSGKYWDHKSSTSSSEESEADYRKKVSQPPEKKKVPTKKPISNKSDGEKPPAKIKKTASVQAKKKRNKNEVTMDLKDMVVQKRMASLNATAILAASYEKRTSKSSKDETTTSDSNSDKDETYANKPKNGSGPGIKSEAGIKVDECKSECKKEIDSPPKQKVEVIVNQDTDVTITGVYSTNREGFCTFSGVKYRISSTSHTQTTATSSSEKESCSHEDARYTPLSALSSMQPPPPLDPAHLQHHPAHEPPGSGLGRIPGCSSAFSAPPPTHPHHDPGYYQPAGPLIKEGAGEESRAVSRYPPHPAHPAHHYHTHPPPHTMLQHYGAPYYSELCYGRYYQRPPGYLPPPQPQPDSQIGEPYPPPQYYSGAPCYHNTHQRLPYMEYRSCPCPMNTCPKNVLIGPATGKPPNSGGPGEPTQVPPAPPGGAFRAKARAARELDNKESDPPARYRPPDHPLPFSGVSPKREICEEFRISTDGVGPPSPARGSAGVCTPQPPPAPPPRRARIGKAMLRKMLIGDSLTALVNVKPSPPPENDDVLVVSSPEVQCIPIDLSSSDETEKREEPHERLLTDVKKENEGPEGEQAIRKNVPMIETQALREHNSPCAPPALDPTKPEPPKQPTKRRYSRPKMEVEPNLELVDGRSTNGIGEHVKLQKRRKLVPETETAPEKTRDVDAKKTSPVKKRVQKGEPEPKRCKKRKSSISTDAPAVKRIELEPTSGVSETMDARLQNPAAVCNKPKIKSALLLDKLIRKNSVDRESIDLEPDPAELFLIAAPIVSPQGSHKVLNINNNVVGEKVPITDTRPKKSTLSMADKILAKLAENKQAVKKLGAKSKTPKSLNKTVSNKNSLKPQVVDKPEPKSAEKINNKKSPSEKKLKTNLKGNTTSLNKVIKDKPEESSTIPDTSHEKPTEINNVKIVPNKAEIPKPVEKPKLLTQKSETKPEKSVKPKTDIEPEKKCLKPIEKVSKLLCSKSEAKISEIAAVDVMEEVCTAGAVAVVAKRTGCRRLSAGRRKRARGAAVGALDDLPIPRTQPRWSNGWMWEGQPFVAKVYLNNDARADAARRCYLGMVHAGGDRVRRGDCVLLRAAARRGPEQPYVARVGHLWENPDDGEMMVSLVWYYRPEHTELARRPDDAPDEVFASRHRDANSVACIEDKCYVLTFNEYCRYRKRLKATEEGVRPGPSIVPPAPISELPASVVPADSKLPPNVSPELVLFCRKIYDFRSKKIQVPNK